MPYDAMSDHREGHLCTSVEAHDGPARDLDGLSTSHTFSDCESLEEETESEQLRT